MEMNEVQSWMDGYIKAWNSNDPEDIGRLFTTDGRYYTAPHREPWSGREQIITGWLENRDEPGEFEFEYQVLGVSDDTGFVRGWTKYLHENKNYSNLWVIRLDDNGQCSKFIEWWMRAK